MRRFMVMAAVMALLGSAFAGSAMAKKPSAPTPGTNSSPHFVPSSFSGFQDPSTGVVTVRYAVAGLGKNGYGYIVARGVLTIDAVCQRRNLTEFRNTMDHDVQVSEHDIFGDQNGNYFEGVDYLRPSAVCPPSATVISATYDSSDVTVSLYPDQSKSFTYDYYLYWGI